VISCQKKKSNEKGPFGQGFPSGVGAKMRPTIRAL
jgi:hypothetical protein